jgi:uncharacterized membrane protein
MREFLSSTPAQVVIWVSVLVVLVVLGIYVISFFRRPTSAPRTSASSMLSQFRELREKGDISPAEFGHIKTVLGPKLQDETRSKDSDRDG